jgi:hypothetical protein
MRTYQTLSLIGCILGILITMGLIGTFGVLSGTQQALLNMTESGDEQFNATQESRDRTSQQRAEFEASEQRFAPFIAGLALSFFIYIGAMPLHL